MRTAGWGLGLVALCPVLAGAQPRLSLEAAVAEAWTHSRQVAEALAAEDRARQELMIARTRHLPTLSVETQVSRLLRPVDVTFPAGAFGTFADGPVPAATTAVTTPARVSVVVNASASQPLTGLWRARLGVRAGEAAVAIAEEETRAARLSVVRDVKRTYFSIVQAHRSLEATEAARRMLTELEGLVADRVAERVSLKADGLDVGVRRAELEVTVLGLRHAISAGGERLNHLMGRALTSPVEVEPIAELAPYALSESGAAAEMRPDVREARLQVQLAHFRERDARIDRWPSVDLALQSITPMNIDGAPRNVSTLAVRASWQPFDWGRQARQRAVRAADTRRVEAAAADAASAATLEIRSSARALEDAQAALRAAGVARVAAEERTRVATVRYRERSVLLVDVLEAHNALADRSARYDRALLAVLDARAALDHALGEDPHP